MSFLNFLQWKCFQLPPFWVFFFFFKNFYRFVTDVDTEWSKPARYEGEPWNQILGFLVSSRRSVSSPHWSHVDLLPHVTSISNAKLHERTDVSSKAELLFVFNPFLIFLPHELSSHFRFFFMKLDLFCVRTQTITEDLLFSVCFFWLIFFLMLLFVFRSLIITVNIKSCLLAGLILFFPLPGMSVCFGHCMFNYSCTLLPQFIPTN